MDLHPQVQGALVGAFVTGIFALIVGLLAHRREEKRRQEDQVRRDAEWFREKLLEAYSGSLYYLLKLGISAVKHSAITDLEVRQHFAEAQRYLLLLQAYSTNALQIERLKECCKKLWDLWDRTYELANQADAAAILVQELLEQEQRVKAPNESLRRTGHANKASA